MKSKPGGKRKGAGAPNKYNEKTKPVSFAVPISKIKEFKEHCKLFLDPLKIKK
jgi:hypothetical protein